MREGKIGEVMDNEGRESRGIVGKGIRGNEGKCGERSRGSARS